MFRTVVLLNSRESNSSVRTVADSLIKREGGPATRWEGGPLRVGRRKTPSPALVQTLQALLRRANVDSWGDSSLNRNFRIATSGEEKIPSAVWWQQFNPP